MSVISINKTPSKRDLAWFGLTFLSFFGLIGLVVWWRAGSLRAAVILWAAAGAVTAVYYAVPPCRRAIYLGWMYAAFPIGWIISHLVLATVYYLVLTPTGLLMRLFGRDPMHRKFAPQATTYWIPVKPEPDKRRYFRQF